MCERCDAGYCPGCDSLLEQGDPRNRQIGVMLTVDGTHMFIAGDMHIECVEDVLVRWAGEEMREQIREMIVTQERAAKAHLN